VTNRVKKTSWSAAFGRRHEENVMKNFFDYFQLISIVCLFSILAGKSLYLHLRENVNTVALGVGKKGFQRVLEIFLLVGLVAWIVEVLLYAFHAEFRLFPSPLDAAVIDAIPAKLIGAIITTTALLLFIWALISFGTSWRMGIDKQTQGDLITTGVFAVSRNPVFLSIELFFIGTFLINGTLIFLIFSVLILAALHYQIIQEEKFLVEIYGTTYQDYCSRTGRYFDWRHISR
jgi:protein-S-isoprenylcysteine O-methyltransferase Ste14